MNITREQIVVMLYRYVKFIGMDVSEGVDTKIKSYEDYGSISDYALTAMQWAVNNGIINGVSESELKPKGEATRAEVATMLVRFVPLSLTKTGGAGLGLAIAKEIVTAHNGTITVDKQHRKYYIYSNFAFA